MSVLVYCSVSPSIGFFMLTFFLFHPVSYTFDILEKVNWNYLILISRRFS